ncbi:MAG: PucR family transcriptional regulator [Ignavibacteriales bacterium]
MAATGTDQRLGIPLEKILQLPVFGQSKILAGEAGLSRLVTGVNIMEVPDIIDWVKPGQLLVTTGFAIRDNKEAQEQLVPSLARLDLAGICIKPRRYIEEIPPLMLSLADDWQFPLVELPPDIGFADVIYEVLSAIIHEQSAYLLQMLDVHSTLMRIMIGGGGLQKIADTLASLINSAVCILDVLNDRQAYSGVNEPQVETLMRLVREYTTPAKTPFQAQRSEIEVDGRRMGYLVMPLMVASECYGHVHIWETSHPLAGRDIHIVERLSVMSALEIARERSLREVERRYSNEFLSHLLSGRVEDDRIEMQHARALGWDLDRRYAVSLVLALAPRDSGEEHLPDRDTKSRVLRELPRKMLEKGVHCLTGSKGDYLVVLVGVEDGARTSREINESAKGRIQHAWEYLSQALSGWDVRIGLGRHYPGIRGLQQSYQEAKQALRISDNMPLRTGVISFSDLGLYRFIYSKSKDREVQNYLEETVGRLLEYDRDKNTELIRTLQCYFEHHGNLRKVSQALFTHYNTVLYRLQRIKEISGMDLDCPEDRFNLEVALRLLPAGLKEEP